MWQRQVQAGATALCSLRRGRCSCRLSRQQRRGCHCAVPQRHGPAHQLVIQRGFRPLGVRATAQHAQRSRSRGVPGGTRAPDPAQERRAHRCAALPVRHLPRTHLWTSSDLLRHPPSDPAIGCPALQLSGLSALPSRSPASHGVEPVSSRGARPLRRLRMAVQEKQLAWRLAAAVVCMVVAKLAGASGSAL
jgi:hypothetical protein